MPTSPVRGTYAVSAHKRVIARLKRTPVATVVSRMKPFASTSAGSEPSFTKEIFVRALCATCGLDEDVATVDALHHLYDDMQPAEAAVGSPISMRRLTAALSAYSAGGPEKTCRAIFDLYCEEGRSYLTKAEFAHYLESSLQMIAVQPGGETADGAAARNAASMSAALAENLFSERDLNHDERLGYGEFSAWYTETMAQPEEDAFTIRPLDRAEVTKLLKLKTVDLAHLFTHFAPFATEDKKLSQDAFVKGIFAAVGMQSHDAVGNIVVDPELHDLATRLFYVFDKDGSNWVDYQELGAGMSVFCSNSDPDAVCRTIFALYDGNNDNQMSLDELTHYISSVLSATMGTNAQAQSDGSGVVPAQMARAVAKQAFTGFGVASDAVLNFDQFRTFFHRVSGGGETADGAASTATFALEGVFIEKVKLSATGGALQNEVQNLFGVPGAAAITASAAIATEVEAYPGAMFELELSIRGGSASQLLACYPSPALGYVKTVSAERLRGRIAASGEVPLNHVRIVGCKTIEAGVKLSFRIDSTFTLRGKMPKLYQMGMATLGMWNTLNRMQPFVNPETMSLSRPAFHRGLMAVLCNGQRLSKDLLALRIIDRIFDIYAEGAVEVNFMEIIGALSVFCVTDPVATSEAVFKFFDVDGNNLIDADEMATYIRAAFKMAFEIYAPPEGRFSADFGDMWDHADVADALVEQCFADPGIRMQGGLTPVQFKRWFLACIATSRHPDQVIGIESAPSEPEDDLRALEYAGAAKTFIDGAPSNAKKRNAERHTSAFSAIPATRMLEVWPVGERSDGTLTHLEGVRVKLNLNTLTLERALQSMRARVDAIAASGDGHPHGPRLLDEQAFLDAMVAAYTSGIDDSWQTMHQIDFLIARIKEKQDAGVRMLWSAAGKYESLDVRLEALRRQSDAEKRRQKLLLSNIKGDGSTLPRALDALTVDILKCIFKSHQPAGADAALGGSGTASSALNRFVPLIQSVSIEELIGALSIYHAPNANGTSGSALQKTIFKALDYSHAGIITKNDLQVFTAAMLTQLYAATVCGPLVVSQEDTPAFRPPTWGWDLETETDDSNTALAINPHDLACAIADQACFEQSADSSLWLDFADFSEWFCRVSGIDLVQQQQRAAQAGTSGAREGILPTVTSAESEFAVTAPVRVAVGLESIAPTSSRLSASAQVAIEDEVEGRGHYAIPEVERINVAETLQSTSPARRVRKMNLATYEEIAALLAARGIDLRVVAAHLSPFVDAETRSLAPSKFKRGLLSAADAGRGNPLLREIADRLFDIFWADAAQGLASGWSLPIADVIAGLSAFCMHGPENACKAAFDAADYSATGQLSEVRCSFRYSPPNDLLTHHTSSSSPSPTLPQPEMKQLVLCRMRAMARALHPPPPGWHDAVPITAQQIVQSLFSNGCLYITFAEFREWWMRNDLRELVGLRLAVAPVHEWDEHGAFRSYQTPMSIKGSSPSLQGFRVPLQPPPKNAAPNMHISRHGSISISR